jgi:predicted TIM-barrel fold metal-dependent hydrolase
VVSAELNCGWLPFFLFRIDERFDATGIRFRGIPFATQLTLKPSEYFRRQLYATFIDDLFGVEHREQIGVENILWSSDFPHSATFWPHSQEKIEKDFQNVGEDHKQKILWQNTAKLYGFNLEQ